MAKYFTRPPIGTPLNLAHPLNRGLVGYWPLAEGAGRRTQDLSGKENHGTLTNIVQGATSGWTGGKFGRSISFDGTDDFVNVGTLPTYVFTGEPFSLSFWANVDIFDTANRGPFVFKSNAVNGWKSVFRSDSTYVDFTFGIATANSQKVAFPGGLIVGNWYHIVIIYNGNGFDTTANYTAHVNGASAVVSAGGSLGASVNETTIGRPSTSAFDGNLSSRIRLRVTFWC